MKLNSRLLVVALVLLPACVSPSSVGNLGREGTRLSGKTDLTDPGTEWTLYPSSQDSQPILSRTQKLTSEVGFVGLSVRSIDGVQAQKLGVEPWEGVYVAQVVDGAPARLAGLRIGDVVLSVAGAAVTNDAQFVEAIEHLQPKVPATLTVLRRQSGSEPGQVLEIEVTPTPRRVEETKTDTFALETSPEVLAATGLQLASLRPEHAKEIYGEAAPVAVVSGTVCGSPAYMAGLRGGDQVLRSGGNAVASARDVREALRDAEALELDVSGPRGTHSARVAVTERLYANSDLHIPIVLDYHSNVERTRWSFLDFILQFGATYSSRYVRSGSRDPSRSWELSLLPFGMFEFERAPGRSRTRLFWIIRWTSD